MNPEGLKNKKIALFMAPLLTDGGGAEKYFVSLARNLRERGIEADVITMDESFYRKFGRFLHIVVLGDFWGPLNISGRESKENVRRQLGEARWIKSSRKDLKKNLQKYDLIYSKNELIELLLLKVIGYKKLPPVIVGAHTPLFYPIAKTFITRTHNFLYLGFIYRWLIRGVKCLHLSNQFQKELADRKFKIKTELIYYPFSISEIRKKAQEFKTEIEFNENKFNVIFMGRLSEQKGISYLAGIIEKLAKHKTVIEKIQINIFGSGGRAEERLIKSLAERYPFVRYFGHVENKLIPDILNHQELFISTSRWETLPFNILEAQAMGIPVLAFNIPGPNDIIENGLTGFLVFSEDEFRAKIEDFAEGRISLDKKKIINNIEVKFNPDEIYQKLIGLFDETEKNNRK